MYTPMRMRPREPCGPELNAPHSRLYGQSTHPALGSGLSLPSFFSVQPDTLTLPLLTALLIPQGP